MERSDPPLEVDVARLDGQPAAVRHHIARVDREVGEHLVDLTGVGPGPSKRRIEDGHQLDVLADQPSEHAAHPAHDRVEVEHLQLELLLAAEREELAREPGGALRRFLDQLDLLT